MYIRNKYIYTILMFFVLILISTTLFSVLGNILSTLILDVNIFSSSFDENLLSEKSQILYFRINQPLNTIGVFLVPSLLFKYLTKEKLCIIFNKGKFKYSFLFFGVVIIFMVEPLVSYIYFLNKNLDLSFLGDLGHMLEYISSYMDDKIKLVSQSHTIAELFINLFIMAILPAISEELFFRGTFQNLLLRKVKNYHVTIWISAFIFGFFHFNIKSVFPIILLGVILGYIYHFSQNILVPMFIHFVNNATLILLLYMYPSTYMSNNIFETSIYAVLVSFALVITVMKIMHIEWKSRQA